MAEATMTHRNPASSRHFSRADWAAVVRRVVGDVKRDHLLLLSGGIAFYAFVAIFPALIAALAVYGLLSDPAMVEEQVNALAAGLPGAPDQAGSAQQLIAQWMQQAAQEDSNALTLGLVVSIGGALWTASVGVGGIMEGINAAYETTDDRPFVRRRGLAVLLTLGGIVFVVTSVGLIAVVPAVLRFVGYGGTGQTLVSVARWPLLAVGVIGALAVLYHVAPDRTMPRFRWVTWGSGIATGLWLAVSGGFSLYVANFGGGNSYRATYGALAGVIVLLFWLFLSALAILLGAEINSEIERQKRIRRANAGPMSMSRRDTLLSDTGW
jgi:membrane protein